MPLTATASMPMPKVYHEWEVEIAGRRVGVADTERVESTGFRRVVVPGRETWFYAGSWEFSVPVSSPVLGVGLLFLLAAGGCGLVAQVRAMARRKRVSEA